MSQPMTGTADNQTRRLLATIKNLQGALQLASDTIMFLADGHAVEGREHAQNRAANTVMALNMAAAKAQINAVPMVDISGFENMPKD